MPARRAAAACAGFLAAALALGGCASPLKAHEEADLHAHVVASDAEGGLIDPVSGEPVDDAQAVLGRILAQAVQETTARQERGSADCGVAGHEHRNGFRWVRRLLVHVHGGLNDDVASRRRAAQLLSDIDAEPGDDWSYPIFLTWPSGGLDSVGEHLVKLRFGSHLSPWLGWPASIVVLPYDLLQGVARAPQTILSMLATDVQVGLEVGFGASMFPTWQRADEVSEALAERDAQAAAAGVAREGPHVQLGAFSRSAGKHAWRFTRYLFFFPAKVVTTPLLVDGIGKEAWRVMLHRASNTLRPTAEFESETFADGRGRDPVAALAQPATGAFARFFERLESHVKFDPDDPDVCWEVTLIGHSMGAIILNDVLQLNPRVAVRNLVYMAAACSIGEAEEALVPYMERNQQTRLYVLTLHPLAEAGEVVAWDLPSRGSLLEWIDQWFESPDHPLDRRLGKWNNALGALHVFAPVKDRVTLKGFGVEGDSKPQAHGDFNDCKFWRSAFWRID